MQYVDQIIILSNGHVEAVGSYDNLRESGLDFVKLLADPTREETGDESTTSLNRSRSGSTKRPLSRRPSETSTYSLEEEQLDNQMQVEEKRAEGSIGLRIYGKYFKAAGGFSMFLVMFGFCVAAQLFASGGDYYVNYW